MVIEINPQQQRKDNSLTIPSPTFYQALLKKIQELHGDFGAAAIREGFAAKYFNERTRIAIVRARHGPHKLITSVLPFVKEVDKKKVSLVTLYTGATMRQCFKFILNHQQKKINEICSTLQSEEEKVAIKEALLKFNSTQTLS
ncbi:hypothetical protein RI129_006026 [Pyrocoelia pectoralis]|uniref:Ribonuclease P/MRP protein subunit POP5 n=1 Tax=Pyrocoelia pectoralis TaxID=417401 RepID=A0AAN7VFR3_9COLE